jgi:hypothetical protein
VSEPKITQKDYPMSGKIFKAILKCPECEGVYRYEWGRSGEDEEWHPESLKCFHCGIRSPFERFTAGEEEEIPNVWERTEAFPQRRGE